MGIPAGGLLDSLGCLAVFSSTSAVLASTAAAGPAAWLAQEMPRPFAMSFGGEDSPGKDFLDGALGDCMVYRWALLLGPGACLVLVGATKGLSCSSRLSIDQVGLLEAGDFAGEGGPCMSAVCQSLPLPTATMQGRQGQATHVIPLRTAIPACVLGISCNDEYPDS